MSDQEPYRVVVEMNAEQYIKHLQKCLDEASTQIGILEERLEDTNEDKVSELLSRQEASEKVQRARYDKLSYALEEEKHKNTQIHSSLKSEATQKAQLSKQVEQYKEFWDDLAAFMGRSGIRLGPDDDIIARLELEWKRMQEGEPLQQVGWVADRKKLFEDCRAAMRQVQNNAAGFTRDNPFASVKDESNVISNASLAVLVRTILGVFIQQSLDIAQKKSDVTELHTTIGGLRAQVDSCKRSINEREDYYLKLLKDPIALRKVLEKLSGTEVGALGWIPGYRHNAACGTQYRGCSPDCEAAAAATIDELREAVRAYRHAISMVVGHVPDPDGDSELDEGSGLVDEDGVEIINRLGQRYKEVESLLSECRREKAHLSSKRWVKRPRKAVSQFGWAMEAKLWQHDHEYPPANNWTGDTFYHLHRKFTYFAEKLDKAVDENVVEDIRDASVHIGNFSMMLFDVAVATIDKQEDKEEETE